MARLQILELPEGNGDDRPPFVLVIDQVPTDETGFDAIRRDLGTPEDLVERIGARAVLVFEETIEIPGNDVPLDPDGYPLKFRIEPDFETFREQVQDEIRKTQGELTQAVNVTGWESELARVRQDRDEARNWARHGYEIGQKHCGWTDHGVAPEWLTEGWPPHIDSCEHLKRAAELDEATARVRATPTEPQAMNADQERPDIWLHGYGIGVRATKAALYPRNEPTAKPTDA